MHAPYSQHEILTSWGSDPLNPPHPPPLHLIPSPSTTDLTEMSDMNKL
jgi:hypothetical protein